LPVRAAASGLDARAAVLAAGNFPVWGRPGIAFTAGNAVVLKAAPHKRARTLLRPAPPDFALPIAWTVDGSALLTAKGQSFDSLSPVVIDLRTGATPVAARQLQLDRRPLERRLVGSR
jgi:hypothetical protein